MAIKNLKALADLTTQWIEEKAAEAGAKVAVFGLSGGVDSALIALLCQRSKLGAVGVLMPCHSSRSSLDRANELASKIGLKTLTVDLSNSHDLISAQVDSGLGSELIANTKDNASEGALRSCLRAPTLDYVAKRVGGFIVGTGNRDEDEVTRYFQKRGDGAVDINPIAKLHKSEVYQLARFLGCTEAILNAVPTADLWGPESSQTDEAQLGITYNEIEWAIWLDDQYRIFGNAVHTDMGQTEPSWGGLPADLAMALTERQRYVLTTLRKMEVASRHKAHMPPVFDPRRLEDGDGDWVFERRR